MTLGLAHLVFDGCGWFDIAGVLHTLLNDALDAAACVVLWGDGRVTHRSHVRADGMPDAKAGPLIPIGSVIEVAYNNFDQS